MPRVNRDLQRRLAARRERERRRPPAERRYRFTTPGEAAPEVDEPTDTLVDGDAAAEEAVEATPAPPPARSRPAAPVAAPTSARGAATARPGHKPFSAYKDEYRYVYSDLRRVALVIGSLLVILIVLYFLLPLLIR
jgi:hypothetical protein